MRLKTASKYIFSEMKHSILVFYLVILIITVLFAVWLTADGNSSFNGLDMISAIFCL